MKVIICIGSCCHLKGARQVVKKLQFLINENGLTDLVELGGTPCRGKCQYDVCVTVDDKFYSVSPETAEQFFCENILSKLKRP